MTALRKTQIALNPDAAPFVIRSERASDVVAREALLDACFGENRHMRTCQRLRDGRAPAEGLALSAVRQGRLVGTLRLWHVSAGGVRALVLGPLAVDPSCRELGVGAALMNHALAAAKARGHSAVVLLGDAPYYARFGFSSLKTGELSLPGPFERDRLLGLELREGALDGAWGMIAPTGASVSPAKARRAKLLRSCRTLPDRAIMAANQPMARDASNPRGRTIATILLIMLIIMIVRDIFARRRAATT
jgi:predicted N-acetyltransferase YhbS